MTTSFSFDILNNKRQLGYFISPLARAEDIILKKHVIQETYFNYWNISWMVINSSCDVVLGIFFAAVGKMFSFLKVRRFTIRCEILSKHFFTDFSHLVNLIKYGNHYLCPTKNVHDFASDDLYFQRSVHIKMIRSYATLQLTYKAYYWNLISSVKKKIKKKLEAQIEKNRREMNEEEMQKLEEVIMKKFHQLLNQIIQDQQLNCYNHFDFYHENGVNKGFLKWFAMLFLLTNESFVDVRKNLIAIGNSLSGGANAQASLLQSFYCLENLAGFENRSIVDMPIRDFSVYKEELNPGFYLLTIPVKGEDRKLELAYVKSNDKKQYLVNPSLGVFEMSSQVYEGQILEKVDSSKDMNISSFEFLEDVKEDSAISSD